MLAERLSRYRADPLPGLPPFQGGAAGLFGYDLCHHLERLPRPQFDEFEVPDLQLAAFCACTAMMRFFHPQMIAQCATKPGPSIDQMIDFVIAALAKRK